MNKYFLKVCLFTLLTVNTFAQVTIQYGPKVGLVSSGIRIINNSDKLSKNPNLNILGGFFLRAGVKKLELQTEAYYQVVGGGSIQNGTVTRYRQRYQYLSIPVLLGYRIVDGLTLQVGPEYSWALNSGTAYGPDKSTDLGITGGVRIDLLDAFSLLSLNIRYTSGLQDITNRKDSKGLPLDFRNKSLQVAFTYNFSEYYKWKRKHKK